MNGVASGPTLQFLSCFAEVFQHLAIESFDLTCCAHGAHEARNGIDDQAQIEFARTQGFLSSLPFVNISKQELPTDDVTFRVSYWEGANLEPAIYAVSTPATALNFVRLPGFECVLPSIDRSREIARMKDVAAGPIPQFLKGLAKIIQILLIDELEFAGRGQSMDKAGNAIDDQAKILFAPPPAFLCALPVFLLTAYTFPAT